MVIIGCRDNLPTVKWPNDSWPKVKVTLTAEGYVLQRDSGGRGARLFWTFRKGQDSQHNVTQNNNIQHMTLRIKGSFVTVSIKN